MDRNHSILSIASTTATIMEPCREVVTIQVLEGKSYGMAVEGQFEGYQEGLSLLPRR